VLKSIQSWHNVWANFRTVTRKEEFICEIVQKVFFWEFVCKSRHFSANTVKVATFGCWGRQNVAVFLKKFYFSAWPLSQIWLITLCKWSPVHTPDKIENKGCVNYTVALPFTLKRILRQKENYGNSNISPCKNIIFKKFL
jgi:hypothetical protein